MTRLLCSESRVDASRVRTGHFQDNDWPKLIKAASSLHDAKIFIDDTPAISVLEMRAKGRRLKAEHDIGLIVVDYLQLMRGSSNPESRQQEISEISRSLKALAKELERAGGGPLPAEPRPGEPHRQAADDERPARVGRDRAGCRRDHVRLPRGGLLREVQEQGTDLRRNQGKAEIIIGKQRNGPIGTVNLAFLGEHTRFENLSRRDDH